MAFFSGYTQDNLLKRKVKLNADEKTVENILLQLSDRAKFTYSYDASLFATEKSVSLHVEDESVKLALDRILPKNIDYKVSGNHLILLRKPNDYTTGKKEKYNISGYVYNVKDGTPLEGIIVYEVSSLVSSVTDNKGTFSMSVPVRFEHFGFSFSQVGVEDTVVIVPLKNQALSIPLKTVKKPTAPKSIKDTSLYVVADWEPLPIVQQLVPDQSLLRTENADLIIHKTAQISLLPLLGTNLKMGGLIENKFSLNVLMGYTHGVDVVEIGGLINITRKNVNGVQVGGLGNLVGGDTHGVQVAGIFNHNRGSMEGVQVGGISNMLVDSLKGVQIGGISNILKGGMMGIQIAGINNLTTRNVEGIQIAGLTNVAIGDVRKMQLAGLVNKAKSVTGVQFAGLVNIAEENVEGFQLAGLINRAKNVSAFQFSGIGNISKDTVSGTQLAGIFNYAKFAKSNQIGLFNIADSAASIPIGLLSFVKKGFRRVELSTNEITSGNLTFKTGVRRFYNIFSGGYASWKGEPRWSFGYGVGTERALGKKTFLDIEYTAHWVSETTRIQKALSLLNQVSINAGYKKSGGLGFSAGPVINVWLSEWKDSQTGAFLSRLAPYTLIQKEIGTTQLQMWVGGKITIQF